MTQIADTAIPKLPRGVRLINSEAHGGMVLLAPERVFKADAIATAILERCTGDTTFGSIVDDLSATYSAPRDRVAVDASALLNGLVEKKLLELG